jgi:cytochrome P450
LEYRILAILLGNGLLTTDHMRLWRRQRALVQPMFAKRHLAQFAEHITAAAAKTLDEWTRSLSGHTIDAAPGRARARPGEPAVTAAGCARRGHRRACVGSGFALMEGVLLAATIAQRFRLDLAPAARVRPKATITLRPRDGMPMTLVPRNV